ncbi:MAG: undecaprenyl-phosphate glucose phosphotransferase [Methylotenera sp.]
MGKSQPFRYNKEISPQLLIKMLIDPTFIIVCLGLITVYYGYRLTPKYYVTASIIFALSFPGAWFKEQSIWDDVVNVLSRWFFNVAILFLFGYATSYLDTFPREVILTWLWLTPLVILVVHLAAAKILSSGRYSERSAVVVGISDLGVQLRDRMHLDRDRNLKFRGFFDDRSYARFNAEQVSKGEIVGRFSQLADFVRSNAIDTIFIALPMTSEPRLMSLLDGLKDTTSSIYFVPNVFMFDLIQARITDVAGVPVIAVCETPFSGMNGLVKRLSDIILSLVIIVCLLPVFLIVSIGVKLSSPGPVLFKQRRYGLDGQEIIVYKFRTMTVQDDGEQIVQAVPNDKRVTAFGGFLRKSSLDELPQFFNVLQGCMSVVGPRPHAISHNELYRKAIKGYMIRHKVKPGITGWAQINGLRGQTETLEKMKLRIESDLDYLRHWSLTLDIKIILKTILLVLKDKAAY